MVPKFELVTRTLFHLYIFQILADTEETKKQLKEIKDRLDDLLKLEKSISEVHGLFLRLQNLVVEQVGFTPQKYWWIKIFPFPFRGGQRVK